MRGSYLGQASEVSAQGFSIVSYREVCLHRGTLAADGSQIICSGRIILCGKAAQVDLLAIQPQ